MFHSLEQKIQDVSMRGRFTKQWFVKRLKYLFTFLLIFAFDWLLMNPALF
jgi:hypothetical protein